MGAHAAARAGDRHSTEAGAPDGPSRLYNCPRCSGPLVFSQGLRCAACGSAYPERDGVVHLVTTPVGSPAYDPHYFATLPQVETTHFWYVTRRELVLDVLRRLVPDLERRALFDVGCGSGGLVAWLQAQGVAIAGACDAYAEGLHLARRRLDVPLALVDEGRVPPLAAGHSLIGLFDVLEHTDDDEAMLRSLFQALSPGGILLLTVPAHPSLFDEADVMAGHRRRYRRAELREKLQRAGFELRALTHFMAPLAFLLAPLRLLVRLFTRGRSASARRDLELRPVPWLNGLLLRALRLEKLLLRVTSLPVGTSLIALACRPETNPRA